jgi:hypothetical protein
MDCRQERGPAGKEAVPPLRFLNSIQLPVDRLARCESSSYSYSVSYLQRAEVPYVKICRISSLANFSYIGFKELMGLSYFKDKTPLASKNVSVGLCLGKLTFPILPLY